MNDSAHCVNAVYKEFAKHLLKFVCIYSLSYVTLLFVGPSREGQQREDVFNVHSGRLPGENGNWSRQGVSEREHQGKHCERNGKCGV